MLTTLTDNLGANISGRRAGDMDVAGITTDSRKVTPGFIFAAIKGVKSDGTEFINQAVEQGAIAVICAEFFAPTPEQLEKICFIKYENPRLLLTKIAAKFYPKQPKFIAAVTGTNGKTSVVNFCRQIWAELEQKSASIGTIGILDGAGKNYSGGGSMTTPDPITLHKKIHELSENGTEYLAIEASSHGLDQYRLDGLKIKAAAFTNLTRDHLDYHGHMENYFAAKKRLFSEVLAEGGTAVINVDAEGFSEIKKAAEKKSGKVISFGSRGENIKLEKIKIHETGQEISFIMEGKKFSAMLNLVGEFQVSNILCAVGIVIASGFSAGQIVEVLPMIKSVPGRMEMVGKNIFVDYAHTPDALEKALTTLRPHAKEKLIVVFGCGGDRDKGKRPEMGRIAGTNADSVIITDDNPRGEDPAEIRKEILAAAPGAHEIEGRKKAIEHAVFNLSKGDILLIAGKGHEKTQIIGDKIYPFDDVEVAAHAAEKGKIA